MLREHGNSSATAKEIVSRIDQGNFAPDDYILQMMTERIEQADCENGYIFDGFPRTLAQAERFAEYCNRENELDHVIELDATEDMLIERLLTRSKIEGRADDKLETIPKRLEIFHERTFPVLEFYRQRGLVRRVDASGSIESVFENVCQAIGITTKEV